MTDLIKLEQLDTDGAVREAADAVEGDSRADFFRKAAMGGTAMLGGGVVLAGFPQLAMGGKPSRRQDVSILNFALTLEYLEDTFYKRALRDANLQGDVLRVTRVVSDHESTHVRFLKSTLGRAAARKPRFDFGEATSNPETFLDTAQVLEDTGVTAYLGQVRRVKQKAVLTAAGTIATVEARHAAFIRELNGNSFAPRAFDRPARGTAIKRAVDPFIVGN